MNTKNKPVNVGVIGFGTVGGGVIDYFESGRAEEFGIHLKKIAVSNPNKPRKSVKTPLTNNVEEILSDPDIHIVVELIGGLDPAKKYILDAINNKKSVVTANKAVMARYTKELFSAAREQAVDLGFEASVGGGIQILSTLNRLKGEKIKRVMGILNGTTNYILTKMEDGLDFNTALKEAQEAGFAEANHILDTGGFDTRDKLALLSSLIFNSSIDPEKIPCHGITNITPADLDFAAKYGLEEGGRGYAIRLLAIAKRHGDDVELRVNPALISKDHPLGAVRGEFNAVFIDAELTGEQMFYGKGAGAKPTTSAVISDIRHIAQNIRRGVIDERPLLDKKVENVDPNKIILRGYVRTTLRDTPGSLTTVSGILAKHGLNIEDSISRKKYRTTIDGQNVMPDIITLAPAEKNTIDKALKEIENSQCVFGSPFFLSFEG